MKIALTGSDGFLGWHSQVRLSATTDAQVTAIDRGCLSDTKALVRSLEDADAVIHIAGANRGEPSQVAAVNVGLAHRLVDGFRACDDPPRTVVFANSVHAESAMTAYGRSKREAANVLSTWARTADATFVDVVLPNLFGEHGRPNYNSFVATFCHEVAAGRAPIVNDAEAPVELLHVQDAAQALIDALSCSTGRVRPAGTMHTVGSVLQALVRFRDTYHGADIPEIRSSFERSLFSTFRSASFPRGVPAPLSRNSDHRGSLVEAVRSAVGAGQTFLSTTTAGQTRGNHYHLRKFERFFVVQGTAEIRLRRTLHNEIWRFPVSGAEPSLVDMPSMWAHAIQNVGPNDLVTLFWTDELFDPADPDTFPEIVDRGSEAGK